MRGNDEASEDDNQYQEDDIQDDDGRNSEDDIEGDDLEDNMEADYEARPELDMYEAQGIDDIIQ